MGQKKGYKQSPEHIAKRIKRGKEHPNYKDTITEKSGRSRALRMYPDIGPCVICGSCRSERHHKDGDTTNNAESNILIICRKCHMNKDGRMQKFIELSKTRIKELQDSAASHKKARTHCKYGHEYNEENTLYNKSGARLCKICRNNQALKSYYRVQGGKKCR